MPSRFAVPAVALCLLIAGMAVAQQPVPAGATPAVLTPPAAVAPPTTGPLVHYARVRNARSHAATLTAGLGDHISIDVDEFQKLYADAGGCAAIVLFLDTVPMEGLAPESCNVQEGSVRFLLQRSEKNDEAWHWLLGSPHGFTRKVRMSVGPNSTVAIPTLIKEFPLRVIPAAGFYVWVVTASAALIGFIYLCRSTGLIRGARTAANRPTDKPYSLARFQMAFWFFLVVVAYVFMWMITGELDTITSSILALIGIGAGTALGSALIDSGASADLVQKTAQTADEFQATRGFLRDVLDDGGGISFHRFQMFVWTLVLGIIFVVSVYRHLEMPEFSATLLGLMGVSSGTYLGFKFPEKTNRESAQAAGNAEPGAPPATE